MSSSIAVAATCHSPGDGSDHALGCSEYGRLWRPGSLWGCCRRLGTYMLYIGGSYCATGDEHMNQEWNLHVDKESMQCLEK